MYFTYQQQVTNQLITNDVNDPAYCVMLQCHLPVERPHHAIQPALTITLKGRFKKKNKKKCFI